MAKYFLQAATPDITPSQKGTWDASGSSTRVVLSTSKSGSLTELSLAVGSTGANYKVQVIRAISGALGTNCNVTLNNYCIGLRENPADTDCYTIMHAYVTQGESTTAVRGTLVDNWKASVEWSATQGSCGRAETPTNSVVAAQKGDRIVVELGYSASAENVGYTGKVSIDGTDVTDLSDGADERVYTGWIDFTIADTSDLSDGVGMYMTQVEGDEEEFDDWIDTLLENGIEHFREVANRQVAAQIAQLQGNITRNSAKAGAKFIYGISSNTFDNAAYAITKENWATHAAAVKTQAAWAQENKVHEFQLGNEEEWHCYYRCTAGSVVRVGTTVTVTTPVAHGFSGDNDVTISGDGLNPVFVGTFDITVTGDTTFTFTTVSSGNVSNTVTAYVQTLTQAELIVNLKALATEVQDIFINGRISYSCAHEFIDDWVTAGRGEIDLIASNIYMGSGGTSIDWQSEVDALYAGFGAGNCYVSEFAPDGAALTSYSTDEAQQALATKTMLDYIEDKGIVRQIFFMWKHPTIEYGVLRTSDGEYRQQLWNVLLGQGVVSYSSRRTLRTGYHRSLN